MNKCGLFGLLFVVSSIVLSGVYSNNASAVSVFDDTYQNTDQVYLYYDDVGLQCTSQDYTLDWSTLVSTSVTGVTQTNVDNFTLALDSGRWGVSMDDVGYTSAIHIFYSTDDSLYLDWIQGGGSYRYIRANSVESLTFNLDGNCEPYMIASGSTSVVSSNDGITKNLFVYTDNPNYPIDYEGEAIPDSYTPPLVYDYIPNMSVVNIVDWTITLQDKNFNTFDNVPFTCNDGLTPVIEYQLINDDTSDLLDSGVYSPTVPYEFNSENYGVATQFRFIGIYDCGDDEGQPTFSSQANFTFSTTASGMFNPEIITGCFIDTFPFVDLENCLNNMADAIGLLSFNKLRIAGDGGGGGGGGGWGISQSCYNMQVLDDWINAPGMQLCPQFPTYIRDTVTPFITFLLGLFMVSFLTRQTERGF